MPPGAISPVYLKIRNFFKNCQDGLGNSSQYVVNLPICCEKNSRQNIFLSFPKFAEMLYSKGFQFIIIVLKKRGTPFGYNNCAKKNKMKIVADKKSFTENILNEQGVRVVEFYADWSGPCQVMAPVYKELSAYYNSSIGFFTVDVEAVPVLKTELGVIELPTILFYKNGMVIDFVNGMISKNTLIAKIENIINQEKKLFI